MRAITCRRPELEKRVRELTEGLANPLFRALGEGAEDEFKRDGTLNPKPGSEGAAVYCRRTPVTQDEIIAKIEIEEACA